MKLLDQKTIRTIETPDEIQFLLIRRPGWITYTILLVFVVPLVWQMVGSFDLAASFFGGLLALVAVAVWLGSNRTLLQVRRELIVANGNLGQSINHQLAFEPASLTSLEYDTGVAGEDPAGLYARQGWTIQCLMPGLTEVECDEIITKIYRKFPDIQIGNRYSTDVSYMN
jgi:hypothetical protein